jgi:hypothetical protein
MANKELPEAITAPAIPRRSGWRGLIDLSFFGADEWSGDDPAEQIAIEHM